MKPIKGVINLPGDKSVSHRALMFSSLTDGKCVIRNISTAEDVESTRIALSKCGIHSEKKVGIVEIIGGTLKSPKAVLDCGNSGTTVRLLTGLLAGQGISAEFIGDKSLSSRPMNRIIEPLNKMGANFESNNGYMPIKINSVQLNGILYSPPIASAQVKSAIIFAGLGANGKTIVKEDLKTRDHSEIMLKELGGDIIITDQIIVKKLKNPLNTFDLTIPGDPSSAAFFAVLAAIVPNSSITIENILANPMRIGVFQVLKKMGVGVEWVNKRMYCGELVADLHIYNQTINGIDITREMIPSIIDEIPALAILASQADSPTIVSGAEELRVKESDRISAICYNLSKMGCEIIEKRDGFIINPCNSLYGTRIKTFDDHRIAMAFSIADYLSQKKNILDNEDCINISFPEFAKTLDAIS